MNNISMFEKIDVSFTTLGVRLQNVIIIISHSNRNSDQLKKLNCVYKKDYLFIESPCILRCPTIFRCDTPVLCSSLPQIQKKMEITDGDEEFQHVILLLFGIRLKWNHVVRAITSYTWLHDCIIQPCLRWRSVFCILIIADWNPSTFLELLLGIKANKFSNWSILYHTHIPVVWFLWYVWSVLEFLSVRNIYFEGPNCLCWLNSLKNF